MWFPRPAIPIAGIAGIAIFTVQIGVHPGRIRGFTILRNPWARLQSPLASHQRASRSGGSPDGGSLSSSDRENSA
jgi:hypothetical protein